MDYIYVILGIVGVMIILVGISFLVNKKLNMSMLEKIQNELKTSIDLSDDVQIVYHHPYQIEISTKDTLYLVKTIRFNPRHELIITSKTFWCINDNIKNWKRSSKPVLVSGVPAFLNYKKETEKQVVKVAIIYPDCYNRTCYMNESDVVLVNFKKQVHQVYFLTFDEIKDFFSSR